MIFTDAPVLSRASHARDWSSCGVWAAASPNVLVFVTRHPLRFPVPQQERSTRAENDTRCSPHGERRVARVHRAARSPVERRTLMVGGFYNALPGRGGFGTGLPDGEGCPANLPDIREGG